MTIVRKLGSELKIGDVLHGLWFDQDKKGLTIIGTLRASSIEASILKFRESRLTMTCFPSDLFNVEETS